MSKRPTSPDERVLPHNLDAEKAVLAACLINNALYVQARAIVEPSHFFRDAHATIFAAIGDVLEGRHSVADPVTLSEHLRRAGTLDTVGGPAYISGLLDGRAKSANVEHYAQIVRGQWILRGMIAVGTSLVSGAYEGADIDALVRQADSSLAAAQAHIAPRSIRERVFRNLGDQRYAIDFLPAGITLEVDRLRRERNELVGELSVKLAGALPDAVTIDGILSAGDFNFSSTAARTTRAKLLKDRGGNSVDWFGLLEEFCVKVMRAEREGAPAIILADQEPPDESTEAWQFEGFPVLQRLPMVLYADSGGGKSLFAMWIAGQLAKLLEAEGKTVIYADWELDIREHRKRFGRLFPMMPKSLLYVRCERSLKHEVDRLHRLMLSHQAAYIICDSIGFALDGGAETHEAATEYFRALRRLPIGSLNLAHIPKQYDDGREAQIFGSTFFRAGGRSIYFLEKVKAQSSKEVKMGLFHKKTNIGELNKPQGFRFKFHANRTTVDAFNVETEDELAAAMPLSDRIRLHLRDGAQQVKQLADSLGVQQDSIRKTLARNTKMFVKIGNRIALRATHEEDSDGRPTAAPELF